MENSTAASTDEALITALNGGEIAAFGVLYQRHRDWIMRTAHSITGDHDAAGTVLQETFLYFADKFPGFSLTCRLRTFLYPVVKNLSLMELRKTARLERLHERVSDAVAPDELAVMPGSPTELDRLLAGLSPDHREVVLLRFVEEFDLREIAQALAVPEGTVKSRLHHALRHLRESPNTRRYFDAGTRPAGD